MAATGGPRNRRVMSGIGHHVLVIFEWLWRSRSARLVCDPMCWRRRWGRRQDIIERCRRWHPGVMVFLMIVISRRLELFLFLKWLWRGLS